MWYAAKAVLTVKFIVLNTYIRRDESPPINILRSHLRKLGKEQNKPEANRRKEIIKIKAGTDEMENSMVIEKINETKSCFLGNLRRKNG